MPISKKYLQNTITKSLNYGQIQMKLSDTLGNLFDGGEIDLSFLLSNGNEYELMNTGGKQEKSTTHGNPFTSSYYNWSFYDDDQTPIQYLGFCLIYAENYNQYVYEAFDLTNLVTNSISGYMSEGWNTFKNSRIILDINNNGLNGTYLSPVVSRSAYAPANPNGGTIQYTGDGESNEIWDRFAVGVTITNYHKFMLDGDTLSRFQSQSILPCFFYNIDGNIFATKSPLYNTYNDNWEYYIDGAPYSYTFTKIAKDTNPTDDLNACGRAGFMYYSNPFYYARFALTYKPLQGFYIVNSSGLRWAKNETTITTAKQFRDNVRLGKMDKNGIVTYNDWIVGETGIQNSDNPNKDMTYDNIPERTGGGGGIADKIDDMTIDTSELGGASIAGAVTYYTMTNVQLSSFMDSLAESTAEHPDIETGFVTASYIPNILDDVARATDMPIRVKGVTLSAHGNKVILQHAILLASFNVPRRHNNALDTLTKYFIYTPYTDVIPLNYKCFGRTLSIYLLPSLQDCTASIVVQCGGMTIAKQTVSLGSSLAISLENNAEKTAAIVNACSKYLVSAGGVIGGALTGNVPAVAGGAIGVVASTVNAQNAIGNTYIHSYGTTTGTTLSLNPKNIYVIEYIVQTDKPDNFAATVGNLVNKEMTLSVNMGYTVCENPRITGDMTLLERAEIENYLKSGVIL